MHGTNVKKKTKLLYKIVNSSLLACIA